MSETVPLIYGKLLEFQKQHVAVKKAGKNPAFRSSYATLNDVLEAVKKPLSDLGVVIVQTPDASGLMTRLVAVEDGSSVEGYLPYVNMADAQKLGGNNTYNRRYLLVTMLGLEEEDDDGNSASQASRPPSPAASKAPNALPSGWRDFTVASVKQGEGAKGPWEGFMLDDGSRGYNNTRPLVPLEADRSYHGMFDEKGNLTHLDDGSGPF